jgi:enoyl-CoA hydratase/carnithine racemase
MDGAEAYRLGIADYLAPEGEALREIVALAHKLAALPAPAVDATKRYFSMNANEGRGDSEANRLFAENCLHETAKATLRSYGVKS